MEQKAPKINKSEAENYILKHFGKLPREMTVDELLFAISATCGVLYQETNDGRYKAMEKSFLAILDGNTAGYSERKIEEKIKRCASAAASLLA